MCGILYCRLCRETRTKDIINMSDDGELLTYNQTRVFHFNQDTTGQGLQENDTICTVNIPLVVRLMISYNDVIMVYHN